jgi:hypothetical protein
VPPPDDDMIAERRKKSGPPLPSQRFKQHFGQTTILSKTPWMISLVVRTASAAELNSTDSRERDRTFSRRPALRGRRPGRTQNKRGSRVEPMRKRDQ